LTVYKIGLYKGLPKETFKEFSMILKKISVVIAVSMLVIAPTLHAANGGPGGNGGHGGSSGGNGGNGGDSK
jgi:uncharacterized membrane protein YgcG